MTTQPLGQSHLDFFLLICVDLREFFQKGQHNFVEINDFSNKKVSFGHRNFLMRLPYQPSSLISDQFDLWYTEYNS